MSGDVLTVSLVSLWMGFAVALQIRTQTRTDAQQQGKIGSRFIMARFINFIVGIAGMLGIASLIGDFQAFRGATFPLSFGLGIAAFVVANRLSGAGSSGVGS
ncbi:hypothetical protein ACLIJR_03880 [Hydrogenophaga sp. XSHU_21]